MRKSLDVAAVVAVVAMIFVALHVHFLSPKHPPVGPEGPKREGPVAAPARPLSLCKTFLEATIGANFGIFKNVCLKEGDGQMKLFAAQSATREMFKGAAGTLAPVCREGYELEFLTAMKQQGNDVFLWKLVPRAGQSQFLVRLTLNKDGKVSGFFFQ